MSKTYVIDPSKFSDSVWTEFYSASTLAPRTYEDKGFAKPFKRTARQIALSIVMLERKRQRIRNGFQEPTEPGETARWLADLETAKRVLRSFVED